MTLLAYAIILLVALQRLVEVRYAERNTAALRARGAREVGARHYPLIVALHASWLVAIVALLSTPAVIHWWLLGVFILLQLVRIWVIAALGPYWTTRIIMLPDAPLVKRGPYRFVNHPNYIVVTCEIAVLPLVFGEMGVAIVFSLLNAAILAWRIRQEETTLNPRRSL
ncbi:MAG TPA: isoprenylcysteine carboxylmethyltransferase family protein [Rhizomicrobium sp.]|jgi:methyltransferase|nr:isoprenylcysteine carboxylmethyltransferase family protein [Rhizomicrobium sp.]